MLRQSELPAEGGLHSPKPYNSPKAGTIPTCTAQRGEASEEGDRLGGEKVRPEGRGLGDSRTLRLGWGGRKVTDSPCGWS